MTFGTTLVYQDSYWFWTGLYCIIKNCGFFFRNQKRRGYVRGSKPQRYYTYFRVEEVFPNAFSEILKILFLLLFFRYDGVNSQ